MEEFDTIEKNYRELNIFYLDDHQIFSGGVTKAINKKFPNAFVKCIKDGNQALNILLSGFEENIFPDIIITDVNHPGLNGLDFCYIVKALEKKYGRVIPVLFITMVENPEFRSRMETLPRVKYLFKTSTEIEIYDAISNFI